MVTVRLPLSVARSLSRPQSLVVVWMVRMTRRVSGPLWWGRGRDRALLRGSFRGTSMVEGLTVPLAAREMVCRDSALHIQPAGAHAEQRHQ
jgi:hypothetical protein